MADVVDAQGNVIYSDPSGTGVPDQIVDPSTARPSVFSVDYYANIISQFQSLLYDLDTAAAQARTTIDETDDPALIADLQSLLAQYDAKKADFVFVANGLNTVINTANLIPGLNLQTVTVPSGLAGYPVLIAGAAILGTAYVLAQWGNKLIQEIYARLARQDAMAVLTPDQQNEAAQAQLRAQNSAILLEAANSQTTASAVSNGIKYAAIAIAVYFAYQAFAKGK